MQIKQIAVLGLLCGFVFLLLGCNGSVIIGEDGSAFRDTDTTNSLGEAHLSYGFSSETVSVRDSATDDALDNIQVLGTTDGDESLYVVADPNYRYHPAVTSGKDNGYSSSRVYLTPVDQHLGTNATSYHQVHGGLLYTLAREYSGQTRSTTVSGLQSTLSSLAYGYHAGVVVCVDHPLSAYQGQVSATEIAQQTTDLSTAFRTIGWQYIYTNRGFSSSQGLSVWVIDPDELQISPGSAGALRDTLLVVVAPTSGTPGTESPGALRVEMSWSQAVDLDLHLTRNGAYLYDADDDCFWKYMEQNWGDAYRTADNPRLLYDSQSGPATETIVMDEMDPDDQYRVVVDYWGDANGKPTYIPASATVRVWTRQDSEPREFVVSNFNYGAPEQGESKSVCLINGATGEVTITRDLPATRVTALAAGETLRKK